MRKRLQRVCTLLVALCTAPLIAHHSLAAFDISKTVSLVGVVKEFQWLNPHSWIQLMVTNANGTETEWSIETSSPSSLMRQGWKAASLKPGDHISVTMHPMREGKPGGALIMATLPDGTKLAGSPAEDARE